MIAVPNTENPHIALLVRPTLAIMKKLMSYTFTNLSHADFEDLTRDLIGRELGVRFEAFTAGPDGGIDGRHARSGSTIILQAKHYVGSPISALDGALAKGRAQIRRLKPKRYVITTSKGLTPGNKSKVAKTLGSILKRQGDIFGQGDLNHLLRKYPDIEKANIKLWLSSTTVLDRVVRAAAHSFTALSRAEIESKVNVYAQNPSFKGARDKLEAEHVVIISGPPGVGKTTLAEMLSYAYLAEEWEYIAIRSLDDGLASIVDTRKQIFFFDDFLGTAALDTHALAAKDSDLARFIKRVRKSPNARFVLTTRTPIFEEARRVSEHLADRRLDVTRYVLDVGIYTRRIRARILYNHLVISGISQEHIQALWDAEALTGIIDHRNYNPRIIEAMTDGIQMRHVKPEEYAEAFIDALDNPHQIWDVSFRTHIPTKCRHLILCLFFCSEYGASIDDLRFVFNSIHPALCKKYSISFEANDFEESLRITEGGFVEITGENVKFINPSLRDYLISYLSSVSMLNDLASLAPKAAWARKVWQHVTVTREFSGDDIEAVSLSFRAIAKNFVHLNMLKRSSREPAYFHYTDLGNADRIDLLLKWYDTSGDRSFVKAAIEIAAKPAGGFNSWKDGVALVKIAANLGQTALEDDDESSKELKSLVEDGIIGILEGFVWPDDLEGMLNAIESWRSYFSEDVVEAVNRAMVRQVNDIEAAIGDIDSESMLEDQINVLREHAPRAGVSAAALERAVSKIEDRISHINQDVDTAAEPTVSAPSPVETDRFDDSALGDLFSPLLVERI